MTLSQTLRNTWLKLRVWNLKRQGRALWYANESEMDGADCGFALRDMLAGGRLSRREAKIHELVAKAKALEAQIQ